MKFLKPISLIIVMILILSFSGCAKPDNNFGVEEKKADEADIIEVESQPHKITSLDSMMSKYFDITLFDEENYSNIYLGSKFKLVAKYNGSKFTFPCRLDILERKGWELVDGSDYNKNSLIYAKETAELTLPKGTIIKNHSDTELQYSATYGDMRLHKGIDIELSLGSEVAAAAKGTVSEILDDALLGKCVTVEYSGNITVKYCGFDTLAVSEGESFSAGRVLGTTGTVPSECADNSHLHIEVKKDGKTVEPLSVFKTE